MATSSDQPRPSLGKRILHEIKMVWILTMYFAAGFGLILLMQNLLLAERGAEQIGYIGAVILAALIGKVIIVIEKMSFTNRFRQGRKVKHIIDQVIHRSAVDHDHLPDMDQFRRHRAQAVHAKYFPAVLVDQQFEQPHFVAQDVSPGQFAIFGYANFVWDVLVVELLFGFAHHRKPENTRRESSS